MSGILNCEEVEMKTVQHVYQWLTSREIGPETRAIAAIFVAKFGGAHFRRSVRQQYERETDIVRAAILYSAQYFPAAEKVAIRKAWGGHSELNSLISSSI